jgi:hypothetical protein
MAVQIQWPLPVRFGYSRLVLAIVLQLSLLFKCIIREFFCTPCPVIMTAPRSFRGSTTGLKCKLLIASEKGSKIIQSPPAPPLAAVRGEHSEISGDILRARL